MLLVKYFPRDKNELSKNILVPKYHITIFNLSGFDMEFWSFKALLEAKKYKKVHRKSLRP